MPSVLGEKIKKLRKDKKLTLEELGIKAESSKSYIWELENKDPPRPSADKLQKIADALETTVAFLVDPSETDATPDVMDEAFYRQYRKQPQEVKDRIKDIMKVLSKE